MYTEHVIDQSLATDFYKSHSAWLFSWLRKKMGCTFEAADLTHDTFLKILVKGELAAIREPRAYLTTTATRLIIDVARRRAIEESYLEAIALHSKDLANFSPEQYQQAIETLNAMAELLDGLPEKVQQAFLMSRLEDLSHAEIAEKLGVSISMVKQYLARAMVHFCVISPEIS